MSEVTNQEQKAYCLDILENGCGELGLTLTEEQKQQFVRYYEMLVEWNKVMNLTGITEFGEVLTKHFVDSLSIVKALDMENIKSCIDVGTGAGFPGIPLKIVFPHLQVTLLDSLNKRLKFLDAVIEDLGLEGIHTVHGRAEDGARRPELRELFSAYSFLALSTSITASAWDRSILPFRNALFVNSPGSAGRAPYFITVSSTRFMARTPPWQSISTVSSPV